MDDHPVVLEQIVESGAIGGYEPGNLQHGGVRKLLGEGGEGRGTYLERAQLEAHDHGDEKELGKRHHRQDGGFPSMLEARQTQAQHPHEENPEEEGALLTSPERRDEEMPRKAPGRLLVDVGVFEPVRYQEPHENRRGSQGGGKHDDPSHPTDRPPFRMIGSRRLQIGEAREATGHEGQKQEEMPDRTGHA